MLCKLMPDLPWLRSAHAGMRIWLLQLLQLCHRCGLSHNLEDEDVVQIVKKKVDTAADGRGRFKSKSDAPLRISDREKKAALKS